MSGGQHVCLVFGFSSATASSSVLGRLPQLLLSPLIGQRERESEREKEREGKREEWEAMDSGIAFLGRGGSKDQDFCWVSIDCPFTDLSKGGDTTKSWKIFIFKSIVSITFLVLYLLQLHCIIYFLLLDLLRQCWDIYIYIYIYIYKILGNIKYSLWLFSNISRICHSI